jgi:hypothetical protein
LPQLPRRSGSQRSWRRSPGLRSRAVGPYGRSQI